MDGNDSAFAYVTVFLQTETQFKEKSPQQFFELQLWPIWSENIVFSKNCHAILLPSLIVINFLLLLLFYRVCHLEYSNAMGI